MEDYKNYNVGEEKEEDVQYFCKFTFGQFFTILILEVVTLAFIFYLGAKYGTNYLKVETAQEESSPQVTEVVAGNASYPVTAQTPAVSAKEGATSIQDAELQALARDAISGGNKDNELKEKVRELLEGQQAGKSGGVQVTEAAVQAVPQPAAPQTAIPQAPAVSEAQAAPQTALPKKTIEQAAQTAPAPAAQTPAENGVIRVKSPSGSPYSIQVGSYPNMEDANRKVDEWRSRGYPSFMMIADVPDRGRWYRVRVGGFSSKDDATVYLAKLKQSENVDGIVVLNEQ
jgi:cell division septation protein DedD